MKFRRWAAGLLPWLLAVPAPAVAATENDRMSEIREMFSSSHSEEEYYRADQLLLTATGSLLPVFKAPSVASVITSDDIRAMGARTLDEVLETVPGLHVGVSPTALLNPVYAIRGIHTGLNPQTLLLYNGVPFQQPNNGSRPFVFRMPVEHIARIEVVRGPGSAVHGADAFAGTINIITKDGFALDGTHGGARAGSFDTYDAWLQHGGQYRGWDVAASIEMMESRGDSDRIVTRDFLKVSGSPASLAPGALDTDYAMYDLNLGLAKAGWTCRFWSLLENDAGAGAGAANALAPGNSIDFEQYMLDLKYNTKTLFHDWDITAGLQFVHLDNDPFYNLFPANTMVPVDSLGNIGVNANGLPAGLVLFPGGVYGNPHVVDQTASFNLESFFTGFAQHRIRIAGGITAQSEDTEQRKNNGPGVVDPSAPGWIPFGLGVNVQNSELVDVTSTRWIWLADHSRTNRNLALQDEWSLAPHWDLVAGVRYDNYSDFGDTVNPRAALVWETLPVLTTKVMYGQAFRPPNFTELYAQNNPSVTGNETLDPETIRVWEMAFDYQPVSRFRSILSVFRYEIEDLIEFVPDSTAPNTTSTAQNHKNQDGHGFELEADWRAHESLRLVGNMAWQRSKNADSDEIVADTPELQFHGRALYTFLPEWNLNLSYYWIGDRHRQDRDPRPDIDNYQRVDVSLRRTGIADHWEVAVGARNLFDEDIREPAFFNPKLAAGSPVPEDYPMEGRSVWGELRFHFR
ncbi:MAG: TonB-dependent receptor [Thermodesulfobacteriota bacterium]